METKAKPDESQNKSNNGLWGDAFFLFFFLSQEVQEKIRLLL